MKHKSMLYTVGGAKNAPDGSSKHIHFLVGVTPIDTPGSLEVRLVGGMDNNEVEVWVFLPEFADHVFRPFTTHLLCASK